MQFKKIKSLPIELGSLNVEEVSLPNNITEAKFGKYELKEAPIKFKKIKSLPIELGSLNVQEVDLNNQITETINRPALNEAKRYVRRYYIRPQNIFCSNKTDVLNALIEFADQDCVIYTLNNLGDVKDVTKLNNNDIIYNYKDGILYDKNFMKVMDYDLYIKHEENRKKINIDKASDATIEKVYSDRLTGNMTDDNLNEAIFKTKLSKDKDKNGQPVEIIDDSKKDKGQVKVKFNDGSEKWVYTTELDEAFEDEFNLTFDDINVYGEKLVEGKASEGNCCICGEPIEGYGNNAEPYKSGRCCDACNMKFVIPARMEQIDIQK